MPYALVTVGLLMIVVGSQGTHRQFATQLQSDLTGGFFYWVAAIGAVGALGYVDTFRVFSHYFLALIIIALLLSNQGFFAKLSSALKSGPATIKVDAAKADDTNLGQPGLFGQAPDTAGQSKFNGWANYLLLGGWLK